MIIQMKSPSQYTIPIKQLPTTDDFETNVGIVVSNYYTEIAERLLSGCLNIISERPTIGHEVFRVMGTWEVPVVAKGLIESNRFGAIIALGCVIRGETSHYDYICLEVSRALMDITLQFTVPVGFGILTVDTYDQAIERSSLKQDDNNKGADAALAVIQSAYTIAGIRQDS